MRISQLGSALIVGLILLLVLTLLGITAMQSTGMQEKMAGNLRDRNLAFQAAEVGIRVGETWLETASNRNTAETSADLPDNLHAWGDSSGDPITGSVPGLDLQLAADPIYLVGPPQCVRNGVSIGSGSAGTEPCRWFYPVVSRGAGGTADAVVTVQTMVEPRI